MSKQAAFSRLLRGFILIVWIIVLSLLAYGSISKHLANLILRESRPEILNRDKKKPELDNNYPTGDQVLSEFRMNNPEVPPIDALLDSIFPPTWVEAKKLEEDCMYEEDCMCIEGQRESITRFYENLFLKITRRLWSIARDESVDPKIERIEKSMFPIEFQKLIEENPEKDFKLPLEIQNWVVRERKRFKKKSLVNTFLILSVLGAFGALIFLIRDYLSSSEKTKMSDYIFRPILGIFLAMAIFIVDVFAHSIISTSNIVQIRYEPLYVLALAAGLLSEKVYNVIQRRAGAAIEQYEGDRTKGQKNNDNKVDSADEKNSTAD